MSEFAGYKIGLSLSRCVQDILEGTVKAEDVLVIVARTRFDFDDEKSWDGIYNGYSYNFWNGYTKEQVSEVVGELWRSGKIHQPRKFGGYAVRTNQVWMNIHMEPQSEAAKLAFDHYQMVLGLSGELELEKDKPMDLNDIPDHILRAMIV